MGKSGEIKPRYRCCVYDLEVEQLYRNLQLQEIKSYGDKVVLEDGTILHKKEKDEFMYLDDDNIVMVAKCLKGVGINLQAVFDDETNRKAGGFLRND